MAKKATTKAKKKEPTYTLSIAVNSEVFELEGENLHDMLKSFEAPAAVKTDMVFVARKGDQMTEHVLGVPKARRAFNNHTALELLSVTLTRLLG